MTNFIPNTSACSAQNPPPSPLPPLSKHKVQISYSQQTFQTRHFSTSTPHRTAAPSVRTKVSTTGPLVPPPPLPPLSRHKVQVNNSQQTPQTQLSAEPPIIH